MLSHKVSVNFTLHTEPRVNPPEFTVTCRTQGGPAEQVQWFVNGSPIVEVEFEYQESKIVINTSCNSVYDNSIFVRGRISGFFGCIINNTVTPQHGVENYNIIGNLMGFKYY